MKFTYLFAILILVACSTEAPTKGTKQKEESNKEQSLKNENSDLVSDNAIQVLKPYRYNHTWVFDDERVNLKREPFVEGIPEIIDSLVYNIPNAELGFLLYFSDKPMPSTQLTLTWIKAEHDGNWYMAEDYNMKGWLCPALFKYYDEAPEKLYVKAEALKPVKKDSKRIEEGRYKYDYSVLYDYGTNYGDIELYVIGDSIKGIGKDELTEDGKEIFSFKGVFINDSTTKVNVYTDYNNSEYSEVSVEFWTINKTFINRNVKGKYSMYTVVKNTE